MELAKGNEQRSGEPIGSDRALPAKACRRQYDISACATRFRALLGTCCGPRLIAEMRFTAREKKRPPVLAN